MQLEVEMKAWVRDPAQLVLRMQQRGFEHERDYHKEDLYFRSAQDQDFRVRLDGQVAMVTYKDKRIKGELEINQEHEFIVSDPKPMIELLHRLGCRDLVQKIKQGSAWRKGPLLLELSEIVGLGFFLEVENVLDIPDGTSAEEQRQLGEATAGMIRQTFQDLEIPTGDIEAKTYNSMLLALKPGE